MTSYQRRRQHWAVDRIRALAKQGKTDEEISEETGIPIINVKALTRSIRDGNQHRKELQGHEGQIRQGESGSQASADVSLKEDRSTQVEENQGR